MSRPRRWTPRATWWFEKGWRFARSPDGWIVYRLSRSGFPLGAWAYDYVEPEHVEVWVYQEACVMASIDREQLMRAKPGAAVPAADPEMRQAWPVLHSYLTEVTYADGSPRPVSSLTLFTQDGVFKLMLKEKALGACLWVSAPTLFGAFGAMDQALEGPNPEWRVDRQAEGQPAKRIKRPG